MKKPNQAGRRTSRFAFAGVAGALVLGACSTPDGYTIADTNNDGRVSPAECERYMLEAIFAECDADGDGGVTLAEWQAANPDADAAKFAVADADRNGSVTPAEAKAHFARQGTMADLFQKMDSDGDGYVSREEAVAFQSKLEAQAGSTPVQKLSQAVSAQ